MLIDKDPSVVHCTNNKTGSSPLDIVCCQNYARSGPDDLIDIIRLLIDRGIDVNKTSFLDGYCSVASGTQS